MPPRHRGTTQRARRGFTLLEVLVALAVLGIAIQVFVSLFNHSVDLGRTATNRQIAAQLASDQLESIVRSPQLYKWSLPDGDTAEPFAIALGDDDPPAGNEFPLPAEMPPNQAAYTRQEAQLKRFRWLAKGRIPESKAPHYEVTVEVRWKEGGRDQMLALTSAVARAAVKERAK